MREVNDEDFKKLSKEFQRFILAPVPGDPDLVKRFGKVILEERIHNAVDGMREASDADLMIALSSLSSEAPLNEEATAIFIHLALKEVKKVGIEAPEMFKEYEHLSDYLQGEMREMKRKLFGTLVRASEKIEKAKKKSVKVG